MGDAPVEKLDVFRLLAGKCVAELSTISDSTAQHFEEMRFEVSRILRKLVEDLPEPDLEDVAA